MNYEDRNALYLNALHTLTNAAAFRSKYMYDGYIYI